MCTAISLSKMTVCNQRRLEAPAASGTVAGLTLAGSKRVARDRSAAELWAWFKS